MDRFVVIGGGLHGLSTALHLARMGHRVTVLERRHVGRHSSGINAGGVRRLGRDVREIALSEIACEMWHRIVAIVGDDCGFVASGQVKLAENADELAKLARREAEVRALGWMHEELVDAAEVRRLVPGVAPHVVGALVCRGDGAADPMRTVMAFRRAAVEAGVELLEGVAARGIRRTPAGLAVETDHDVFEGTRVANCAGMWAAGIARGVGDDIPIRPRASMMMVTERVPRFVEPTIGATSRPLSFKQSASGTLVIGGGLQGRCDPATETSMVDFRNLARGARTVTDLFPAVRDVRIVRTWCGIEAETPDGVPVIGESPACPGLVHSFGYSGHGFQLAPAAGAAVAGLLAHGSTDMPVAAFAPARLAGKVAA